ncbi:hypothetical protein KAR91_10895 [Candidatus Pacearchaeota archaeon]|nr:hypothetical protein [Candidatus Pacearchaeota archaeon]
MGVNDGVDAVWHLNNSLVDSSGNGHTLTKSGAIFSTTRKLGSHSLRYDGINDYALASGYQPSGDISVFIWVKLEIQTSGGSTWRPIISNGAIDGTGFMFASLSGDAAGIMQLQFDRDHGNLNIDLGNLGITDFNLVGFTWDESSETFITYVNGNKTVRSQIAGSLNIAQNDVYMGASVDLSSNRFFKGWCDEPIIYNRAISEGEATRLWKGGVGAEWPLPLPGLKDLMLMGVG